VVKKLIRHGFGIPGLETFWKTLHRSFLFAIKRSCVGTTGFW